MLIVPDFSAEDIKTGLDIIDSEYKELLRFSSRTRSLLQTLGVHFKLREDIKEEKDECKTRAKRIERLNLRKIKHKYGFKETLIYIVYLHPTETGVLRSRMLFRA